MKIEIRACAWLDGGLLFEAEVSESVAPKLRIRAALELSVKAGAYLSGADLSGAYLSGADLSGADLRGKTLAGRRPYLAIGPLGSREDFLYAYITTDGVYVQAGCFFGTRDEFEAKVADHHGDNEYGQEYRSAIALIDVYAKLWTPTAEQLATIEREQAKRKVEMEKRFAKEIARDRKEHHGQDKAA